MVEIMDGRVGKRSVEHVKYVINNLLHLVIVTNGVISLVVCICTRLRLMKILTPLVNNSSYFTLPCVISTIYMVYVRPDNQYHAHTHCFHKLTLTPDIA